MVGYKQQSAYIKDSRISLPTKLIL